MIQPEDLQIIVLTYNRADFLRQTLDSICAQTVKGFDILVLDNGSTDGTQVVLKEFKSRGVKTSRADTNLGSYANFLKAQEMAEKDWVIIFHDDDLMHPDYVAVVLETINAHRDMVLVGSGTSMENDPKPVWKELKGKVKTFLNASDFAAFLCDGFPLAFSSVVYRAKLFKSAVIPYEVYGKIFDRPFLFDVATHGGVAVLTEPYVKYRLHPGQDIKNSQNGPFENELIALSKKYHELLGENIFSKNGRIFVMNYYKGLRAESHSMASRGDWKGFPYYVENMIAAGVASKKTLLLGKIFYPVVFFRDNARRILNRARRYL